MALSDKDEQRVREIVREELQHVGALGTVVSHSFDDESIQKMADEVTKRVQRASEEGQA